MKKTIKFYTPQEEKRMIQVYNQCNSQSEASVKLAKEMKRKPGTIQVKLSNLLREKNIPSSKAKQEAKGVVIPKGFTFDIKPSKAVMFEDHVRLYF
jgi:hypothetical protein